MGKPVTAYVHKGCKTSKGATDYMEANGIAFQPVELYDETPTADELRTLLRKLSVSARELLRPRDRMYRELDLRNRDLPEDELIRLMAETPGSSSDPSWSAGTRPYWGSSPSASTR